jgi:hypothetical protein
MSTFPFWDTIAPLPVAPKRDIDLDSYDKVLVAFSGGKDSISAFLHLLELGVPPERIELHQHDVDGGAGHFMDWPITPGYCKAVAERFRVPLLFSFKEGGFEREMLREKTLTAPIKWQRLDEFGFCRGSARGTVDQAPFSTGFGGPHGSLVQRIPEGRCAVGCNTK